MKRIVLAITLVFISVLPALAQDSKSTGTDQVQREDFKALFIAKTNELEASLTGKNKSLVDKIYNELSSIMQRNISDNMVKLKTANDAERGRILFIIDQQNAIYSEAKLIYADPKKKREGLAEKIRAFSRTL